MKYEFVHKRSHDWCFEELNVIEQALAFVENHGSRDPIRAVSNFLAGIFAVKFIMIGKVVFPEADQVQTVSFLKRGQPIGNVTYNLKDSPCQHAIDYRVCYYPSDLQSEFPRDQDLANMNVNSYMGTALIDPEGKKIGIIALMHSKPMENPGFIEHILTILSPLLEQHIALTEV